MREGYTDGLRWLINAIAVILVALRGILELLNYLERACARPTESRSGGEPPCPGRS